MYEMTKELKRTILKYLMTFFSNPMFDVQYKKRILENKNFVIQMLGS